MDFNQFSKTTLEAIDTPVIFTDKSGRVTWVNNSFEHVSGYSLSEMMGKTPGEVLQGPGSDPDVIEIMSEAIKKGLGFEVEILNYHKSGEKYMASIKCEPVHDDHDVLVGFISIQPALNRRQLREYRKLEETSKMLNAIFNYASVAIILANDDMKVVDVNPAACRLLGYPKLEFTQLKVMDYTKSMTQAEPLWDDFIEANIQKGSIELLHKTGRVVHCEYQAVANVLPGLHLSVIVDITERIVNEKHLKAKSKELEVANADKNALISIIAHDLRSPLARLGSLVELWSHGDMEPEEMAPFFKDLLKSLENNQTLLNNLLYWTQSQQKGFELKPKKVAVDELVQRQLDLFEAEASSKNINIQVDLEGELKVLADENMLDLVLRNLCTNAIKFCDEGNNLTLSAYTEEDKLKISVMDDGPGIPPEKQKKIFLNGYSTLGSAKEKGSGLGLALCKHFLKMHDSDLHLESEVNQGANFYFYLEMAS